VPSVQGARGVCGVESAKRLLVWNELFHLGLDQQHGPLQVFSTIGGLHIFIMLMTIPMWIFGKKCRSLTARKGFYKTLQGH